jgi:hypothetical protein
LDEGILDTTRYPVWMNHDLPTARPSAFLRRLVANNQSRSTRRLGNRIYNDGRFYHYDMVEVFSSHQVERILRVRDNLRPRDRLMERREQKKYDLLVGHDIGFAYRGRYNKANKIGRQLSSPLIWTGGQEWRAEDHLYEKRSYWLVQYYEYFLPGSKRSVWRMAPRRHIALRWEEMAFCREHFEDWRLRLDRVVFEFFNEAQRLMFVLNFG